MATVICMAKSPARSRSSARTVTARHRITPTLRTSGPAAPPGGTDMRLYRNSDGQRRFEWRDGKLLQRSVLDPALEWELSLVKDSVNPEHPEYNEKAARAKLMSDNVAAQDWGLAVAPGALAHKDEEIECYTCHTSWMTSCAGCHLPIEANWKTERHHYEGGETRNYATYNPQVARDEMFMLGKRGPVNDSKIAPVRSSSALVLSSTNANRERIYVQQPPIAASGFSSQAMNPHFPHTARKTETKTCSNCHLTADGDNNALMAQLLLQGTNFVNFIGLHAWAGLQKGIVAAAGHRVGRTAGRHRQLSAALRLSGQLPPAPGQQPGTAARLRIPRQGEPAACNCAASTCSPPPARRAWSCTTWRISRTRASARKLSLRPLARPATTRS